MSAQGQFSPFNTGKNYKIDSVHGIRAHRVNFPVFIQYEMGKLTLCTDPKGIRVHRVNFHLFIQYEIGKFTLCRDPKGIRVTGSIVPCLYSTKWEN